MKTNRLPEKIPEQRTCLLTRRVLVLLVSGRHSDATFFSQQSSVCSTFTETSWFVAILMMLMQEFGNNDFLLFRLTRPSFVGEQSLFSIFDLHGGESQACCNLSLCGTNDKYIRRIFIVPETTHHVCVENHFQQRSHPSCSLWSPLTIYSFLFVCCGTFPFLLWWQQSHYLTFFKNQCQLLSSSSKVDCFTSTKGCSALSLLLR